MGKGNDPFNNPFRGLQPELTRQVERHQTEQKEQQKREAARAAERLKQREAANAGDGADDFRRAMVGVTLLNRRDDPVRRHRPEAVAPAAGEPDPDAEAYAQLADLVSGVGQFDISDTVEYVEGLAPEVDRRLLRRLKRGDFALQGHLDLHGLTLPEARVAVRDYLTTSRVARQRCVLIVHGRGLNSKDQEPVLKPALVGWLAHGRMSRRVLAFCTAKPVDGGAGALCVLLRK